MLVVDFDVFGIIILDFSVPRSSAFSALIRSRVDAILFIYGEASHTTVSFFLSELVKLVFIRSTLLLIMFTP